ncbi:hypothetical protein SMD44_01655 [Streptomyces alboflavus]|uniref:Uncharacterized protein n=1 Tax=Streptomyces alboflavus TaxID=67267 RepID=A0A1Z1W765_9ACTN|nr:hypothetical protein SMD44_01655 [Streptomyces alboflavus]
MERRVTGQADTAQRVMHRPMRPVITTEVLRYSLEPLL